MKNTISWASLALSTLVAILPLASCQKENLTEDQSVPQTITRTIAADIEALDSSSETKSVYEAGQGVHLTNTEYMSVFYSRNNGDNVLDSLNSSNSYKAIRATPDGNGKWTFTHPAVRNLTSYDYSFVLPHSRCNEIPGNRKQVKTRLYSVQYPTQTSFDPGADILVGKAQFSVNQISDVNNVTFKRLFAPVKLIIYDNKNALNGEKIHAVSFSLSQAPTNTAALVGLTYFSFSDNFDSISILFGGDANKDVSGNSLNNGNKNYANSVTALNANGIQKEGDTYTIWYMMNPLTIASGTKLTLTVTSDTKTITRTATIPDGNSIVKDKINKIKFDISGDGYTSQSSAYCDFSAVQKDLSDLTATDGSTPLSATNCIIADLTNEKSPYPNSLKLQKSTVITVNPAIGKTLNTIRLYTTPLVSMKSAKLSLKVNDTTSSTIDVVYAGASKTAGYLDFTVPDYTAGSTITITRDDNDCWLSGITLFYK